MHTSINSLPGRQSAYRLEVQIGESDFSLQEGNVDIVLREAVQPTPTDFVHLSLDEARHSSSISGYLYDRGGSGWRTSGSLGVVLEPLGPEKISG